VIWYKQLFSQYIAYFGKTRILKSWIRMKIIIACNPFKGNVASSEAFSYIAKGVLFVVSNPLIGIQDAIYVYGLQKGLNAEDLA